MERCPVSGAVEVKVYEFYHWVQGDFGNTRTPDLPVVPSAKFEFAINLGTVRALGIEVPETLAIADE
jgi:hypothetical protein